MGAQGAGQGTTVPDGQLWKGSEVNWDVAGNPCFALKLPQIQGPTKKLVKWPRLRICGVGAVITGSTSSLWDGKRQSPEARGGPRTPTLGGGAPGLLLGPAGGGRASEGPGDGT